MQTDTPTDRVREHLRERPNGDTREGIKSHTLLTRTTVTQILATD